MHMKEPLHAEYELIRKNQIVFTYLHLAANEELTHKLLISLNAKSLKCPFSGFFNSLPTYARSRVSQFY